MCSPINEDCGEAAINDPGEGTWSWGLLGEFAVNSVPGEGVPISPAEGLGFT